MTRTKLLSRCLDPVSTCLDLDAGMPASLVKEEKPDLKVEKAYFSEPVSGEELHRVAEAPEIEDAAHEPHSPLEPPRKSARQSRLPGHLIKDYQTKHGSHQNVRGERYIPTCLLS